MIADTLNDSIRSDYDAVVICAVENGTTVKHWWIINCTWLTVCTGKFPGLFCIFLFAVYTDWIICKNRKASFKEKKTSYKKDS